MKNNAKTSFHSDEEREAFLDKIRSPIGPGDYFLPSHRCRGCHGFDTLGIASRDANGVDINLFDDWRATMMANSARDPLWRAKVSHEMLTNPGHAIALQDKCTSCHAPMGKYSARYKGNSHYGLEDIDGDTLGIDGVACGSCHAIGDTPFQNLFSGNIPYDTTRKEFGPFTLPMQGPMQLYEGLTPTYSPHISASKVCSHCHTLITETADLNGTTTGGEFIEQATFHEWLNSGYSTDNVTCQSCHMPKITTGVIIANEQLALPPRSPFNQHQFAGANTFMLKLLKTNRSTLNIPAENKNFDSTIVATEKLLKTQTAQFTISLDSLTTDTAFVKVFVKNKAGHKLPSGYPARRLILQIVAINSENDTVFKSGTFNSNYTIQNETEPFEPHHQIINENGKNQIYEMVMGDVNGNFTTVLERASVLLKDNRIPPEGFTTLHSAYDTTIISDDALNDPNFNRYNANLQGSGRDIVYYHIPISNAGTGTLSVFGKVYYQAVPPKWLGEMFLQNSTEIETFRNLYTTADKSPFLVAKDSLMNLDLITNSNKNVLSLFKISPNPSEDGLILIQGESISKVTIYNSLGQLVKEIKAFSNPGKIVLKLPNESGIYFLQIRVGEKEVVKKVVKG